LHDSQEASRRLVFDGCRLTEGCDLWLDPAVKKPEALQRLLRPYRSEEMITYPVGTQVNNPVNSECITEEGRLD